MASNKGKAVDVQKELFGGFDEDGGYVIKTISVRRTMAKGEVKVRELGCEHDVFTFCLYHSKVARFDVGGNSDGKCQTKWNGGHVDADRWRAAQQKARQMLKECKDAAPAAKIAKLRKLTKGAKVPIAFER